MSAESKWKFGKVDWFDELSGRGFVRSESGEWFFVHKSALDTNIKTLKKNQDIKFQVFEDINLTQVSKIKVSDRNN